MFDTDLAYGTVLRGCYAVSGTELGYDSPCSVLTQRMVLPGDGEDDDDEQVRTLSACGMLCDVRISSRTRPGSTLRYAPRRWLCDKQYWQSLSWLCCYHTCYAHATRCAVLTRAAYYQCFVPRGWGAYFGTSRHPQAVAFRNMFALYHVVPYRHKPYCCLSCYALAVQCPVLTEAPGSRERSRNVPNKVPSWDSSTDLCLPYNVRYCPSAWRHPRASRCPVLS
eukprot:2003312-Rhodomonas_salina.4